mgnify:CR=1 FL=1
MVAELEQTISGSKEELSDILHQQIAAGHGTEQIRKEGEAIRQEVSELTTTNYLLLCSMTLSVKRLICIC